MSATRLRRLRLDGRPCGHAGERRPSIPSSRINLATRFIPTRTPRPASSACIRGAPIGLPALLVGVHDQLLQLLVLDASRAWRMLAPLVKPLARDPKHAAQPGARCCVFNAATPETSSRRIAPPGEECRCLAQNLLLLRSTRFSRRSLRCSSRSSLETPFRGPAGAKDATDLNRHPLPAEALVPTVRSSDSKPSPTATDRRS
jgi:hypothetical protein